MMPSRATFLFAISSAAAVASGAASTVALAAAPKNRLSGFIVSVSGNRLVVRNRSGKQVTVDLSEAAANGHVGVLAPNLAIELHGTWLPDGTFHCVSTSHCPDDVRSWETDT